MKPVGKQEQEVSDLLVSWMNVPLYNSKYHIWETKDRKQRKRDAWKLQIATDVINYNLLRSLHGLVCMRNGFWKVCPE